MKILTQSETESVRRMFERAASRFDAGERVAHRTDSLQGEFDSNFEGVIAGIHSVVEGHILATTGMRRKVDEASAPTLIASVVTDLNRHHVPGVPPLVRLTNLNGRRNASAHQGDWLDVIDQDALEDAVIAGRALMKAVRAHLQQQGVKL